ncbi:MAG TPA: PQQ-binding-like beta-propeller repeat protein [Acidimicrobiales bacterium]|nr:PQQ-binding-like beta-propeller repeat protein [Acidimicrobiales bacterium]
MLPDGPRQGRLIRSATKRRRQQRSLAVVLVLSLLGFACVNERVTGAGIVGDRGSSSTGDDDGEAAAGPDGGPSSAPAPGPDGPTANESGYDGWVDPASSGNPWTTEVSGLLTFRGNPTRSYYGSGPMPTAPEVLWSVPGEGGFCGESAVGGQSKTWCGTGWTGQPSVWEDGDTTWVGFGAYDKNVHFLDATDGTDLIEPFDIGDIVKGSVTRDPDGFPLLYSGSRADFHVIATDRPAAESLWSMNAEDVSPTKWNDDWDSSPLVIDDYLFEGGENGQWYVIKLNRGRDAEGLVTVDPEIVFHAPGWDEELTADLSGSGSRQDDVSIEDSLAISGDTVYFTNSGGLVQGWDIGGLADGEEPRRTFRFWTGDDTDASIVVDEEGMLYVAQEVDRSSSAERNAEVGQLIKLDPTRPDDPLVWSVADDGGMWATPAIAGGVVIAPTDGGRIVGVDRETGEVLWEKDLPGPTWSSPVVVDDVWVQGDCNGVLHGFDLSDPRVEPPELWAVELEGCVESTPAVWDGRIYVGARGGKFYALGDP